ncbi:hypothetical protein [Rhizobium hidalgonense]|uniref:hypothetical protein n=1 Tax=Rhizobium hidalgonense TaxID=1538159 RepID=UPI001FCE9687|nr:hypothetical protein [Rhizobium hidalgonense]
MTQPAAIFVRGLEKRFGDKAVLRGIDLDVHSGDVTCIIGPSSRLSYCSTRLEESL